MARYMEIFYHGTSMLFKKFDIAHALDTDGFSPFLRFKLYTSPYGSSDDVLVAVVVLMKIYLTNQLTKLELYPII